MLIKKVHFASMFALFLSLVFSVGCGSGDKPQSSGSDKTIPSAAVAKATATPAGPAVSPPPSAGSADPAASAPELKEGEIWENGKKYYVLNAPNSLDPTSPENLVVASHLGYFDEQGIKINFVGAVPSGQQIPSVLTGILHMGGGHVNTAISAIAAGAKIKAVVQRTESSQKIPHMVAVVKIDSDIKTAKDLGGKKLGTPGAQGCNGYFHLAFLRKHGIPDPKNYTEMVVIKEALLEQALRQGDIDAALFHRTPSYFDNNKEFRVFFSDYDIWENRGGGTPYYMSTDFIAKRPDVVRGFATAMAKTNNWANERPFETRKITADRAKTDVNKVMERYFSPDGIIKPESVTVWIDILQEFKEISGDIPLDKIFTNELNPFYRETQL
ncbi:MAG: ABC transporter substrate-binding protein [Deltaproteobacteria bacterium]|jgi:ABC-type nitrate/sulfonate/bicarbonate transport system substrate-binding protein|nr:ABC transporter substrate-binding protein [Deltaproteobacteria bacterium]